MAINTLRENEKRLGPKFDEDDKAPAAGQCLRASAADRIPHGNEGEDGSKTGHERGFAGLIELMGFHDGLLNRA